MSVGPPPSDAVPRHCGRNDERRTSPQSAEVSRAFDDFVEREAPRLALPGSGGTWRRFSVLADFAARDLSLGRWCEGHADALAILAEAGRSPVAGASYGVWTSRSSNATTYAERVPGGWRLSGRKEFCSGGQALDRALVSAMSAQGYLLFDISVADVVSASVEGSWPTIGMARSLSETLEFDGSLRDDDVVGSADFYLARPGFWFGGAGVAACWFGGAVGLLNGIVPWISAEPRESVLVDLGGAVAALETMSCVLTTAARAIDDDPTDRSGRARFRTLVVRRVVHDAATTVLEKMASAGGARALCHDEDQSRRAADLYVYLSQHHGNADSQEMGRTFLAAGSWNPSEVTSRT